MHNDCLWNISYFRAYPLSDIKGQQGVRKNTQPFRDYNESRFPLEEPGNEGNKSPTKIFAQR